MTFKHIYEGSERFSRLSPQTKRVRWRQGEHDEDGFSPKIDYTQPNHKGEGWRDGGGLRRKLIRRFLKTNINRPWNDVYSELNKKLKETNDQLIVDEALHWASYNLRTRNGFYQDDAGILRGCDMHSYKNYRHTYRLHNPPVFNERYVSKDGLWYELSRDGPVPNSSTYKGHMQSQKLYDFLCECNYGRKNDIVVDWARSYKAVGSKTIERLKLREQWNDWYKRCYG